MINKYPYYRLVGKIKKQFQPKNDKRFWIDIFISFGAGVLPTENRVFAQFVRSAIRNENIFLHTEGKSEGNYIYTSDAIRALLFLLLNGETMQAYNVANKDNHMIIRQMA